MIGQGLSHYRIVEKIGAGGMGQVFKARDERLDRYVAIKVLREDLASSSERLRRFEQEARSASALNHPNIITIHDIGKHEGTPYIAMEFVEGRTLRKLIADGPLTTENFLGLATQIAEGLAKAHTAGIIHRDLKPENLMVTSDGYVKILDFGLAKLLPQSETDSEAATITKEGTVAGAVIGTASYMSPEQALGKPLDARTDVFSLGSVLYEMATGSRPFRSDTSAGLFNEILNKTPDSPSSMNPEIPTDLDRIIGRALEKDVVNRYPSANELLFDLKTARTDTSAAETSPQKSIIVLPFENMSPDPEQEYFCDGMTEEIITDLSHIQALRVISRISAMTFKGTKKRTNEIAKEVNVRYALEGSVRKAGNNLRITAQLIDTTTEAHLWAEKYRGTLDDVFDIQEEVSRAITDVLKLKLSPEEEEKIAGRPFDNVQAYECYLKARQEYWFWEEGGLERAKHLIENGLKILGDNELLYSALGLVYNQFFNTAAKKDMAVLQKAEECARKIFALNPSSSHGHNIVAYVHYNRGNVKEAVRHLEKALALDPSNLDTLIMLPCFYSHLGKVFAGRPMLKKILEIDPLHPFMYGAYAMCEMYDGRFEAALEKSNVMISMSEDAFFRVWHALVLSYNRRFDEAHKFCDLVVKDSPQSPWAAFAIFLKYSSLREREKALQSVTEELTSTMKWNTIYPIWMSERFAFIGEKTEALDWLEYGINYGCVNYPFLNEYDPFLESIRGEERFKKLMETVKYEWEHFEV